ENIGRGEGSKESGGAEGKRSGVEKRVFDRGGTDSGGSKKVTMIGFFLLNCLRVRRVFSRRNNSRVEIAVSAFRLAERHLNVDSEIHCATHDFSTAGMAPRASSVRICNDFYLHRPLARSVIFAEENALPPP